MTDIAAGGAPRPVHHVAAAPGGVPARLSRASAMASPRPTPSAHRISGPIMRTSRHRPGGRMRRSSRSRSSAKAIAICPRARSARSRSAPPANIRGYWKAPEATAALFTHRSLCPHRRHRLSRRGQLSVHRRPQEGHHHPRRREHRFGGGRGRLLRLPRRDRGKRVRGAGRAARRGPGRGNLQRNRPQRG